LLLQKVGRKNDAVIAFREGLKSDPMDHDLNYIMFLHHFNEGDRENALIYLENLVRIDPSNSMYKETLANLRSAVQGS
jgi:tetratricopeptide (TPR) repeat protein